MRVCVWCTGHEIADTVALSLAEGFNANVYETKNLSDDIIKAYDAHIAYGILRGTADVFNACSRLGVHWFNVDRGFFNPAHYEGYYRISYRGTQPLYNSQYPLTKAYQGNLRPWYGDDKSKPILVCPPTEHVSNFFGLDWWIEAGPEDKHVWRQKGTSNPINWDDYRAVITFNSSVGWQALINGVPCLSDTTHSVVGSYYNTKSIDTCLKLFNTLSRKPLLNFMAAHQFTLAEIRQGFAWPLLKHYLSSSAGMPGKPFAPMSASTPSESVPRPHFQLNS